MLLERSRAIIRAAVTLIAVTFVANSAIAQSQAQSGDTSVGLPGARPKYKPIDLEIEASFSMTSTTNIAGSKKN